MTPEQKDEMLKAMRENFARQEAMTRKQRFEAGEFSLDLIGAPDDPPVGDDAFQKELADVGRSLRDAGIPYSQTAIAMDAVDAHGYPLPEYVLAFQVLVTAVITPLAAVVGAWINGRYGRKARLKIGDIEAEARTPAEVEELLKPAAKHQDREHKKHGHGE
jgi:hypothetical protein